MDGVLQYAQIVESKYFALQILEGVICTKWRILEEAERNGIKNFIVSHILELTDGTELLPAMKLLLHKYDLILVEIVKHEWPKSWPSFIPDMISSAKTSEPIFLNNMEILQILSEEVFRFGSLSLVHAKENQMRHLLSEQLQMVYGLCYSVIEHRPSEALVVASLQTMEKLFACMSCDVVFKTDVIRLLCDEFYPSYLWYIGLLSRKPAVNVEDYLMFLFSTKHPDDAVKKVKNLFSMDAYRVLVLDCLTEIVNLDELKNEAEFSEKLQSLFVTAVREMAGLFGANKSRLDELNQVVHDGNEQQTKLINAITNFLTSVFKNHMPMLEMLRAKSEDVVRGYDFALSTLVALTKVDDIEILKTCLEFWTWLSSELYRFVKNPMIVHQAKLENVQVDVFLPFLSTVRAIVVERMSKPKEVLIVENEQGEIIRELVEDADAVSLYHLMRECLVILTHLDKENTVSLLLHGLEQQCGDQFSLRGLNTLCWATGAISGTLTVTEEKSFLTTYIKELLSMVRKHNGKNEKIAIASNIMYIVSQYPRFLRGFWKLLKIVVKKLFEFMRDHHEGVQDMACETLHLICKKCRMQIAQTREDEPVQLIDEILQEMPKVVNHLSQAQTLIFFEAVGYILASLDSEGSVQRGVLTRLMSPTNDLWSQVVTGAQEDIAQLHTEQALRGQLQIVRINIAVCKSTGAVFSPQMCLLLDDLLSIYCIHSTLFTDSTAGEQRKTAVKLSRAVKRDMLVLLETWIGSLRSTQDKDEVMELVPRLFEVVVDDYKMEGSEARDPQLIQLVITIINQLQHRVLPYVKDIYQSVYMPTLAMINLDMEAYPEHRMQLFDLLLVLCVRCFDQILSLQLDDLKLIFDSIIWAFQHTMRDVADKGLELLRNVVSHMGRASQPSAQEFFQRYFVELLDSLLAVVTDVSLVKVAGVSSFAETLCVMFYTAEHSIRTRLNQANTTQSNVDFIYGHVSDLLAQHFHHLSSDQVRVISRGFFSNNEDPKAMRLHLRDFLLQLTEAYGTNCDDLFLEEAEREIQKNFDRKAAGPAHTHLQDEEDVMN